ncbi:putative DNA uptake protein [Gluconacetobacter diazotrophicus PA1 5]|uniref:Putative DNA uptake protein n=1 Tax=Gluconacetobacter diazotrophicus (strain ATCC 49037 / DSM 5601 / CCUG 37298 / CIP 103539 / LMG 7603 / PAl5) TaxID=272568 RepID=A9GZS4_GLUDA|nr:putative DNA uptake protein [Gluconacetobacter diazotrophicus PA1 5]
MADGRREADRATVADALAARLALWLPVGIGLGIALYFSLRQEPGRAAMLAAAGVVAAALGWIARRPYDLVPRVAGGGAAAVAVGFVVACTATHRQPPLPDLPRRATIVTGQVVAVVLLPPRPGDDGPATRRVDLAGAVLDDAIDAGMPPLRRILRVRLRPDDPAVLVPGMTVRVRAMLRPPAPPAWPGGPDRQRRAWFDGTAGTGTALGPVQAAGPPPPPRTLEGLRERVVARILRVLPGAPGGVAAAVLTGSAATMPQADRDAFADAGLAHLLAVAGLHLGIVMGLVMAAARLLLACSERATLYWPCRQVAALAGLAAGIVYVVLTGAHLPALRSLTMAALVVLAILTGRRALSMRGLAVGATLLLLTGPADLLEAPLQMSLAAVMALAAGFEATRPALSRLREQPDWWRRPALHVAHLALASLLAGGATVPVVMTHFGTLQPWFVLANLLAVPLMALWILPWGVIALLLMPWGADPVALVPMGWGIRLVLGLAHAVSGWPAARVMVPAMPSWGLAAWMLGLCWLCLWTRRWRWWGVAPMALALAAPVLVARPDVLLSPDGRAVAVRDGAVLRIGPHPGADKAVESDWQQALALPLASLPQADGRLACRDEACRMDGGRVRLRLSAAAPAECAGVTLLVTLVPMDQGCPAARTLDGLTVWQGGAQAVFLRPDGPHVVSDRGVRGARPWVLAPGQHGMPTLPLAQRE